MPLTAFQSEILRTLASRRAPDSFVAGGTVLNAGPDSPRFSKGVDTFDDTEESAAISAETDAAALRQAGLSVEWLVQQPLFRRAAATRDDRHLLIEWVFDSAFRFFPVEADSICGWRLNEFDAATNKVLALIARSEPRDYVDTIYFHQRRLSLGALCWAAAGKDPGVNPFMILEEAQRNTRYRTEQFHDLNLAVVIDLPAWKRVWISASQNAQKLMDQLPAEEVGCLYLDEQNIPVTPDPASPDFPKLKRHFGSVHGAWPVIRN